MMFAGARTVGVYSSRVSNQYTYTYQVVDDSREAYQPDEKMLYGLMTINRFEENSNSIEKKIAPFRIVRRTRYWQSME